MRHIITTIVPCEIAPTFAAIAAHVLDSGQESCTEGAGALLAIANAIVDATDKTYGLARSYEVDGYWRPYADNGSCTVEGLPAVLLSIDEETRRTAGTAAGRLATRAGIPTETSQDAALCRDWCRYTLHDECAYPVYKI